MGIQKPIGKWLTSPSYVGVSIGSSDRCEVWLKWQDDNVLDEHFTLKLENGNRVMLYPNGSTFVNERELNGPSEIHSGETIELGIRNGKTKLRLDTTGENQATSSSTSNTTHANPEKAGYQRSNERITIRKRS